MRTTLDTAKREIDNLRTRIEAPGAAWQGLDSRLT